MKHGFATIARATTIAAGIIALNSTGAFAQTTASAPASGPTTLRTGAAVPSFAAGLQGKDVWITAEGVRMKGLVTSLNTESLVLYEDGTRLTIDYNKIVRVEKSTHRIRNGALIGLASGLGVIVPAMILACEGDCGASDVLAVSAFYGGLGAAAGAGIGAMINAAKRSGTDVLYDARHTTRTMTLAPILSPTRKGVAFSMSWQ